MIDPGAHEQGAGIVATVANAVNPFRYLPMDAATEWSAREWAETRRGWVFLTCEEGTRAAILPLLSLWLDSMVHRLLSTELERGARERVWIVAPTSCRCCGASRRSRASWRVAANAASA